MLFSSSFQLSGEVKNKIFVSLQKGYGIELRKNSQNRLITDAWDSLQRSVSRVCFNLTLMDIL